MVRRYREVKTIVLIAVLLASIAGTGHAEEPKFIDLQVKAWGLGALEVGAFHGYCAKVTILETGASNYTYGSDSAMFHNISVDAYPNVTAIVNAPYANCWSSQPQLVLRANTTVNETINLLAAYNNNESLHTEIITVSGFVITVEIPSNGSTFNKGDNITIRTRVEYMCGCPSGCSSWEEDRDYPPVVTITYPGGSKEEFSLWWAGSCSPDPTLPLYNASYVLSRAGAVTINVSMKKGPYDNNMTNYGEHVITIDVVDNAPPSITFVPPTDDSKNVVNRNWTYINVTLDEDGSSVWLDWNGTNESIQGSGASWYLNKTDLANGNYTYRVWANDSVGNLNVSETRGVTLSYAMTSEIEPLYSFETGMEGFSIYASGTDSGVNVTNSSDRATHGSASAKIFTNYTSSGSADTETRIIKYYSGEDWTRYTKASFDVYISGDAPTNMETRFAPGSSWQPVANTTALIPGQWNTRTFDLSTKDLTSITYLLIGVYFKSTGPNWSGYVYIDNVKTWFEPTETRSASIEINADQEISNISRYIFGSSAGAWYLANYLNNQTAIDLIKKAGITMLRIPGGSISDDYDWKYNDYNARRWYGAGGYWVEYPYTVSLEQFLDFSNDTNTTPLITVNVGFGHGIENYTNATSGPQYAADMVDYVKNTLGRNVTYWEIGNEPNFYTNVDDYSINYTEYYTAMKAVDPKIKIMGPVVSNWNVYDSWFEPFINKTNSTLEVFSYHYYTNSLPEPLLDRPARIDSYTSDIRGYMQTANASRADQLQLALTEWHTNPAGTSETSSYVSALFGAEFLGRLIKNNYTIGTQWEVGSNQNFGLLDYTNNFQPRPMYYAFKMYAKHFGDIYLGSYSNVSALSIYASRSSNSTIYLLVINKNDSVAYNTSISLNNFNSNGTAKVWVYNYTYPSISKSFTVSNISNNTFNYVVSPYSITAIEFDPAPSIQGPINFTLNSGWNLISIPLEQSNWSLTSVLAPIEGQYNVVFAYIGGGWKRSTAPRDPLTNMSQEYGYWINMTEPATLELRGTMPSVTTINVSTGWNLMSYPSLTVQNLTTVLSPINYTAVFEYRDGIWERSTAPRDPLTNMSPGYGYWVNASEAGSYGVD